MAHLNPRHLDHRRALIPSAYALDPRLFGVVTDLEFRVPPGGDVVSMRIAQLEHLVICEWEALGRRPSAAALCRRFGFSPQTLSKVTTGQRWAGETLLAALQYATRRPQTPPEPATRPADRHGASNAPSRRTIEPDLATR